jgi:hypothetical protein
MVWYLANSVVVDCPNRHCFLLHVFVMIHFHVIYVSYWSSLMQSRRQSMAIFILCQHMNHVVDHDGGDSVRVDIDVYTFTLCDFLNWGLMSVVCDVADQLVFNGGEGGGISMEAQEEFCCTKHVIYQWGCLFFSPTLLPNRDSNFHFGTIRDVLGIKIGGRRILRPLLLMPLHMWDVLP